MNPSREAGEALYETLMFLSSRSRTPRIKRIISLCNQVADALAEKEKEIERLRCELKHKQGIIERMNGTAPVTKEEWEHALLQTESCLARVEARNDELEQQLAAARERLDKIHTWAEEALTSTLVHGLVADGFQQIMDEAKANESDASPCPAPQEPAPRHRGDSTSESRA